jgi:hypothetical protein
MVWTGFIWHTIGDQWWDVLKTIMSSDFINDEELLYYLTGY